MIILSHFQNGIQDAARILPRLCLKYCSTINDTMLVLISRYYLTCMHFQFFPMSEHQLLFNGKPTTESWCAFTNVGVAAIDACGVILARTGCAFIQVCFAVDTYSQQNEQKVDNAGGTIEQMRLCIHGVTSASPERLMSLNPIWTPITTRKHETI